MNHQTVLSKFLAILQLTRAALIFTAISDSCTLVVLRFPGENTPPHRWLLLSMTALASACLYAFGMSLNDLLDVRRDRLFACWRPLPSGRISHRGAIVISLGLLMLGLFFGAMVGVVRGEADVPWSLLFCFMTAIVIVFYNATAKYLGALGLLCLGAVRALNCMIGYPHSEGLVLPIVLFTHVALISLVAYYLEHKRPRLKPQAILLVVFGIMAFDGLAFDLMIWKHTFSPFSSMILAGPLIAAIIYWLWCALTIRSMRLSSRAKGSRVMLIGLLWLFVYDGSLLAANRQWLAAGAIGALGLCSVASFFLMRLWGRGLSFERPHYRMARRPGSVRV